MANVLQNPADIINASLVRIGYGLQIASLYDGSKAAQKSLAIYGQTRDKMLRDGDWGFAQRSGFLTLLKTAPASYVPGVTDWDPTTNPPIPWKFEYAYLDDCLKVRAVKPTPIFLNNPDPQPYIFSIDNDSSYAPPQRVILCNVANAICVYTGQVTDPLTWPPDFTEALIDGLGKNLATGLATMQSAQMEAAEEAVESQIAMVEVG